MELIESDNPTAKQNARPDAAFMKKKTPRGCKVESCKNAISVKFESSRRMQRSKKKLSVCPAADSVYSIRTLKITQDY